jgi:hypothetical protein
MKMGYEYRVPGGGWRLLRVCPALFNAVASCVLLVAAYASAQEKGMEMSRFRVPDYDDKGNMTAQLFGRHAEVGADNEVRIDQLRIEFYQNGATFATVESPFCFYNSQKRAAHSDAAVTAVADKIRMEGRGFEWDPASHSVRIFNDVHVVVENAGRVTGSILSSGVATTGGVVTITSRELFLDYTAKMVQFEKEVCVVNDDGTEMRCEKLKIPLGEGRGAEFFATTKITEPVAE